MVLFSPLRKGYLRYAHTFERFMAGAESNTAVGLSKLGHTAGWISRVGNDEFGKYILSYLKGEGVDISHVQFSDSAPTGVFFKERRHAESTRIYYYRSGSAASELSPEDIDLSYVTSAKILHLTGITPALSASCLDTTRHVLRACNDARMIVSFDPNIRFKLWASDEAKRVLLELLPLTTIVLASRDEASLLTGYDNPEKAAQALLALGPRQVVIKLGPDGALGVAEKVLAHSPGIEVQVVETIGAGDAFNAGYLAGQLRGWDLNKSLHLGNILGAMATTASGDVEGLPDWQDVQSLLDGNQLPDR